MKTCSHAKLQVQNCHGYGVTLLHVEEDEEDEKSCLPVFCTWCDISIQFFACSYVLHLDVLKRQIEIETESKTKISLCMAIMLDNPWQSRTTVLCDTTEFAHSAQEDLQKVRGA